MSYHMQIQGNKIYYQLRCDQCGKRFAGPEDNEIIWFFDADRADQCAVNDGWQVWRDVATGFTHHRCGRHRVVGIQLSMNEASMKDREP